MSEIHFPQTPLVRVVGKFISAEIEVSSREENVDHVFVTIEVQENVQIVLSLNTLSYRNRIAGFDPRIRIGAFQIQWNRLPHPGIYPMAHFDYETVEVLHPMDFRVMERVEIEDYFLLKSSGSRMIEAWGVPYKRLRPGLHQIHSRRASMAVREDIIGRDGAVRFYYEHDQLSELILLKFTGQ